MLITREREKLLNAIIYFVNNTKYCGATKLFKLLNFLDFTHFRRTGRSVTGLNYYAWERGPVPAELFFEIKTGPKQDLTASLDIAQTISEDGGKQPTRIKPKTGFNAYYFTKRELQLMEELAFIYVDATAEEMSKISHVQNQPWDVTVKTKGAKKLIDYMLAVDGSDKYQLSPEDIAEKIADYEETKAVFS